MHVIMLATAALLLWYDRYDDPIEVTSKILKLLANADAATRSVYYQYAIEFNTVFKKFY
jgi:hypothetical protein